jgi:uncharacterized membrane protein SpoIIM required for sporulation
MPLILKSATFRQQREPDWLALEDLVHRARLGGIRRLSAADLQRLPLLYRATLSSLSVARAIALDRHLLLYLEDLALRAYLVVYGPQRSWAATCRNFLARGFPAAARAAWPHILASFLCVFAGSIAGYMLTEHDEAWFSTFIPPAMAAGRGPASTRDDLLKGEIFAPWPGAAESFGLAASMLFEHNTIIGILSFGLGIFAGLPTIFLMLYQGLVFGSFLCLHAHRGLLLDCIGWVSIHGVTEFGAIIISGAGGFYIAEKLVFPGRYTRADCLALHGETAARLAVGAMLLFLLAAILEGGFRQLVASTPLRLLMGFSVGLCWIAYLAIPRKSAGA